MKILNTYGNELFVGSDVKLRNKMLGKQIRVFIGRYDNKENTFRILNKLEKPKKMSGLNIILYFKTKDECYHEDIIKVFKKTAKLIKSVKKYNKKYKFMIFEL